MARMGDVVSSHLDEAKRETVAGEELLLGLLPPVLGLLAPVGAADVLVPALVSVPSSLVPVSD